MHTIVILAAGFLLLGVCVMIGKLVDGSDAGMAKGAIVFLPLWLIGAGVNMWFGVAKAGYSVSEELPVFGVIFAVPAAVASVVLWRLRAR
jgi:hypothetical protein